jgi:hypothetical protein
LKYSYWRGNAEKKYADNTSLISEIAGHPTAVKEDESGRSPCHRGEGKGRFSLPATPSGASKGRRLIASVPPALCLRPGQAALRTVQSPLMLGNRWLPNCQVSDFSQFWGRKALHLKLRDGRMMF